MKKLMMITLFAVGFSSFAQDQNQSGQEWIVSPEQAIQVQLQEMTAELNLDAKQQEQIKSVLVELMDKKQAILEERISNKDNQKNDPEYPIKRRKELIAYRDNKLKAILSPKQFKKMKDNEMAIIDEMIKAAVLSGLEEMTVELNLDTKQQEQLKPVFVEWIKKQAIVEESIVSKGTNKSDPEYFSKKELDNKLKAILSSEQFKKMKDKEAVIIEELRQSRESREKNQQK